MSSLISRIAAPHRHHATMGHVTILARGVEADGTQWELDVSGGPSELRTMVTPALVDGRRPWGSGSGGPAVHRGRRISVSTGSGDNCPTTFIARVTPDVRAVVVTLSDGTREDLVLHGDPQRWGARIAVLMHPHSVDVHRIDLFDAAGTPLPERDPTAR